MRIVPFILVFSLCAVAAGAQDKVGLASEARPIPKYLFGMNGRSTEGPSWDNQEFLNLVRRLAPRIIRYPGGTLSNYWDWRTGTFIQGVGKKSAYPYTIPMVVQGLPPQTAIVYVMNMVRPTPATGYSWDNTSTSLEVLNKKIDDALAALQAFKAAGKLPVAVELGNELYFNNDEAGIYANKPKLYVEHAKIISQRIKEAFPEIGIILCTTKYGLPPRDAWNEAVLEALASDPDFRGRVQGIVQHHYLNEKYGGQETITDDASAIQAIAEGYQYTLDVRDSYDKVPEGLELWLTEYGIDRAKANANDTWAAGLRALAETFGWIDLGPKIANLSYHHLTYNPDMIDVSAMKQGPIGMTLGFLNTSARNMTQMQKLDFPQDPTLALGLKSLVGYLFGSEDGGRILFFANFGDQPFPDVDFSDILDITANWEVTKLRADSSFQKGLYDGKGIRSNTSVQQPGKVTIDPFSVYAITVKE